MTDFRSLPRLDPIVVGHLCLVITDYESNGQILCSLVNRENGEVREQLVDRLPSGTRWRTTVADRMARIDPDYQTPLVLLKGVR